MVEKYKIQTYTQFTPKQKTIKSAIQGEYEERVYFQKLMQAKRSQFQKFKEQ